MAGELQYVSAAGADQGKLLFGDGGALDYECCCDENEGDDCPFCPDDPTPLTITAVISGVNMVTACCICNSGVDSAKWKAGSVPMDPNGTHVLTQDGVDPCLWTKTITVTGWWQYWDGVKDCSGAATTDFPNIDELIIRFWVDVGGTSHLLAYYWDGGTPIDAYYGTDTIGASCWTHTSSNTCDCGTGCWFAAVCLTGAEDGSATVTNP